jgi:anaerobic ribonucleoside-triphosphate reductase activating protein
MLKYVDTLVSFQEVPDEITLCINISNCPCHCEGCHSPYLAEDIGVELTVDTLTNLIKNNKGITCVCLMGGDNDPKQINLLAKVIKSLYPYKVAWYSGSTKLAPEIIIHNFDYIKLGPYIEEFGPLNNPNTNQKMFKINHQLDPIECENITYKFWK